MKNTLFAVLALALAACGGAKVENKNDAAQVSNMVTKAAQGAGKGAMTAGMFGLSQLTTGINGTVTVKGKEGGTANVTLKLGIDTAAGVSLEQEFTVVFKGYEPDDDNKYDGTITFKQAVAADSGGAKVEQKAAGKVKVDGDYASDLDFDFVQKVDVANAGNTQGVTVLMTGYVTADGKRYDFANEGIKIEKR